MIKPITKSELNDFVETQTVEFKNSLSQQKAGLESLCGMINSDSGTGSVYFGVAPDGSISGIEPGDLDSAQQKLAQHSRDTFDPPIQLTIEIYECEGKNLIEVSSTRNRATPLHEYNGRAFIREGATTRRLSITEREALIKRRSRDSHTGPWICDRCNSFAGSISSVTIGPDGPRKTYKCHCGGEFWPAG